MIRRFTAAAGGLALLSLPLAAAPAPAATQDAIGRKQLEHEDYDKWNSLSGTSMTEAGDWVAFTVRPAEGAATLHIREVATRKEYAVKNGSRVRFTHDGTHAVYLVVPDPEKLEAMRKDEDRKGPLPKPRLEILHLESGRTTTVADVSSFSMPAEASGWLAYRPAVDAPEGTARAGKAAGEETLRIEGGALTRRPAAPEEETTEEAGAAETSEGAEAPKEEAAAEEGAEEKPAEKAPKKGSGKGKDGREKDNGDPLVLHDLATGAARTFPNVSSFAFGEQGKILVMAISADDGEDDGVHVLDLASGALSPIASGRGAYRSLAISEDESHVAFLTDKHDFGPVKANMALYLWTGGEEPAAKVVDASTSGMPEGWWLAPTSLGFTEDGRRLILRTQPKPEDAGKTKEELEKEAKAEKKADPVAALDIWHWKDLDLQPRQLLQAGRDRGRSYAALYHIADGTFVQVEDEALKSVRLDRRSTADVAVGVTGEPYGISASWESPSFADTYVVNLLTGERLRIVEKVRGSGTLSPTGAYVTWWDADLEKHFAMSVADGSIADLSEGLPLSLADELNDRPMPSRSYGVMGWYENDTAVLLYDRYDIWQVDPTGAAEPRCVTGEQAGRANLTRYRYVPTDAELRHVPLGAPVMVSIFDERTKQSGYGTLDLETGEITPKLVLDERIRGLRKAPEGDTVLLTRETFRRYPDLWATTTAFESLDRLSWTNPQQRDYLWGTAELVEYETTGGEPLQGLLYKPDNFDPTAKYPMMVYFYERNSDTLHRHVTPSAGRASINYAFYVSRGYVVFVPDIPYEEGHPGQSAANAVLPGVQTVVDMGFVDPARIGVQGHSWGGYQIAYLVTMTDVFACAESGAPVSNMTSAYGGIRWASGLSRMFQYEKTQSRIGDTLWGARDLYIENSPVFFADKVNTPLLILHNDGDGAVPWYQGIELFVALRRLGKPAWMLNYNGEGHGLGREENKLDFAKRMQQFFDHHLMGAPATKWISDGVPAVEKGEDLGLDAVR